MSEEYPGGKVVTTEDTSGRAEWEPKTGEEVWMRGIITAVEDGECRVKTEDSRIRWMKTSALLPVSALATPQPPMTNLETKLREALLDLANDWDTQQKLCLANNESANIWDASDCAKQLRAALDAKEPPACPHGHPAKGLTCGPECQSSATPQPSHETSVPGLPAWHGELNALEIEIAVRFSYREPSSNAWLEPLRVVNEVFKKRREELRQVPTPRDEQPSPSERERIANWARAFLESYFSKKWSGYQLAHLIADVQILLAQVRRETLEAAPFNETEIYTLLSGRFGVSSITRSQDVAWLTEQLNKLADVKRCALSSERKRT